MYGMYSGQANQHSLAFWDETMVTRSLPHPLPLYTCRRCFESMVTPECRLSFQAKTGCNEVLTCIHRFHVLRNTGSTHLNWSQRTHTPTTIINTHGRWGDNTTAQIHNSHVMLYNNEAVREDGFSFFRRIDNKYSPPGHTFMEVRTPLAVGHLATVAAHDLSVTPFAV
jgi:hypothetical protein